MVTIFVGPEKAKYLVHKPLLVKHCLFFDKCLNCGMKESLTNEVHLPDKNPKIFDGFVKWISTQYVEKLEEEWTPDDAIDLWLLADEWLMPKWQNSLVDELIQFWKEQCVDLRHFVRACQNDYLDHFLCLKVAKDQFLFDMSTTDYEDHYQEQIAREELDGLVHDGYMKPSELVGMFVQARGGHYGMKALCAYHVHKKGETCPPEAGN